MLDTRLNGQRWSGRSRSDGVNGSNQEAGGRYPQRAVVALLLLSFSISGCQSVVVEPERWELVGAVQPDDRVIELFVIGAACDGSTPTSEIEDVEVEEDPDSVTITVWTRTTSPRFGGCTDAGVILPVKVDLSEPVGTRAILDGSLVG